MKSEYFRVDQWDRRRMTWEINGHSFNSEAEARADYEKAKPPYRWRVVRVSQEVLEPVGGEDRGFPGQFFVPVGP